jgi:ankyrin repeat protein
MHRRSESTGNILLHRAVYDKDMQLLSGWSAAGLGSNRLMSDYSGFSPLTLAVVHHAREDDLLKLLCTIEPINRMDRRGWAAIHYASSREQRLIALSTLVEAGADLNLHTTRGESPLALCVPICVKIKDATLFHALIQRGADPDIRNPRTNITPRRLYNAWRHWWDGEPLP